MADGSLGGLGSSIGLTATAKDYSNLYRYNQQAKAQKAKAKDDKLEDIIKLVTVKSSESKLHPLEVGSMEIRTGQFVQNLRRLSADDDIRGIDNEVTSMFADLNEAQNRSNDYWGLEKTVKEAAAGNKYVPKNVRQAARIMVGSESSADFITALNDNQVRRNDFLDYDDNGRVVTQSFDYYDINKSVKDLIAGNSVVIGVAKEPYTDPNTKTTFFPRVMGIPIDDEEAKRVSNMVDANGNLVRPMLTAKEIPLKLLNNTSLAAQYIDQYNLEDKTSKEIEDHFYENMVEPNVKRKETIQTAKPPSSLTINNQPGTAAQYAFIGAPKAQLNFMEAGKLTRINSAYSVQLAPGNEFIFQIAPGGAMIAKEDNTAYSLVGSSGLKANYLHVLPYREVNGVKYVISEAAAKAIYAGKVKYAPFVEGKMMDFTVQPNVSNPDYYTEFTTDILGGFAGDAATKGKQASAAFAEGIKQLNKKLVSLGAKPVSSR